MMASTPRGGAGQSGDNAASDGSAVAEWSGVSVSRVALEACEATACDGESDGDVEPPVAPHAASVAKRRAHANGRTAATSGRVPETARTLDGAIIDALDSALDLAPLGENV
jgi:hypothetical protein